jgi:pre-mRNA-processing factor 6
MHALQDKKDEDAGDKQEFDAFMGNDAGMFAYGEYDEEDKEADRVWESVDARMDERRKVRHAA